MRLQHDAGQVSLLAVQQAEVQKETTAALIPELEQALMTQENALSILMAEAPQAIPLKGELAGFSVPAEFSAGVPAALLSNRPDVRASERSEEHTSELQSLMRISYAVFCLKKKNKMYYPTT